LWNHNLRPLLAGRGRVVANFRDHDPDAVMVRG